LATAYIYYCAGRLVDEMTDPRWAAAVGGRVGESLLAIGTMIDRNCREVGRLRLRVGRRLTA